jgi:hypothetical protein
VTFGGTPKQEKVELAKPKPAAAVNKEKEEDLDGRKWVFDTIQKYFDVIVEEENEEEEEEDEEEEEEEADDENCDENCDESESDYTSAEDELPEINIQALATRKNNIPKPSSLPSSSLPRDQE